jgi:hypothetical protein
LKTHNHVIRDRECGSRAREAWLKHGRNPGGCVSFAWREYVAATPVSAGHEFAPLCRPLALFAPPEHGVSPPEPQLPVASRSCFPQLLPAVAAHPGEIGNSRGRAPAPAKSTSRGRASKATSGKESARRSSKDKSKRTASRAAATTAPAPGGSASARRQRQQQQPAEAQDAAAAAAAL